jgi:tetratricopeptide (TPR) repeat protein
VAIDSSIAQYQRADGSGKELLVDQFHRSTLGSEYSAGVQVYNGRDSLDTKALVKGAHHFLNSTYIYPDSSNYYYLASDLFYLGGQEDRSMELIKSGLEVDNNPDPYPYQRLATLYTARGETDKSTAILEEGIERVDDDINLIQLLADAYITGGKTREALALLEDLISRNPENATYHLVYGSQVYNSVVDLVNELETTYDNLDQIDDYAGEKTEDELKEDAQDLVDRISTLTDTAIEELKLAIKYDSENVNAHYILGKVYTNKAAILIIRSNYERDIEKSNELRAQASEIYEQALEPLEAGVAIDGENTNLWNQLFQVYTRLGMNDKAAEAMEKAGI